FATTGGSGIAAFTGYATTLAGATSTTNVKLTDPGSFSLGGATSVNALLIVGNSTATALDEAGNTLSVGSGGLVFAGPQAPTISNGTLAFGGTEGVVQTGSGAGATLNSVVTGTGGLTFGGAGTT